MQATEMEESNNMLLLFDIPKTSESKLLFYVFHSIYSTAMYEKLTSG